jgi:hypothetical protein
MGGVVSEVGIWAMAVYTLPRITLIWTWWRRLGQQMSTRLLPCSNLTVTSIGTLSLR